MLEIWLNLILKSHTVTGKYYCDVTILISLPWACFFDVSFISDNLMTQTEY